MNRRTFLLGILFATNAVLLGLLQTQERSFFAQVSTAEPVQIQTAHDTIYNPCSSGVTKTAVGGDYTNPGSFTPFGVPSQNDKVMVPPGVQIAMNGNDMQLKDLCINNGTVVFLPGSSAKLTADTILVYNGGALIAGTQASPIAATQRVEIVIDGRAVDADGNDHNQILHGIVAVDGTVMMHGAVRTPTFVRLTQEPQAGGTTLRVESPVNWRAGDKLILPDSRQLKGSEALGNYKPQWEELAVGSVSPDGLTITIASSRHLDASRNTVTTSSLGYDHPGARDSNGTLRFLPHVGNLTRNVVIRSLGPSVSPGHILLTGRTNADIRFVEIDEMSRTKNDPIDSFDPQNPTNPVTNQIGRYALHAHHLIGPQTTPPNGYQFTFLGNALNGGWPEHNRKWGIAIHDSHYGLIQDNVVYNTRGAGIAAEDGSETENLFDRNLVVRVSGSGDRGDGRGVSNVKPDLAHDGVGFWFRGGNNRMRRNVAMNIYNQDGKGIEGNYGIKFFSKLLGNVSIPLFKGADPSDPAQAKVVNMNAMPVLEFDDNEVYASMLGMTVWWINGGNAGPLGTQWSTFRNLTIWNVYNRGIFQYAISKALFDHLTILGSAWIGWGGNDYMAQDIVFDNLEIDGPGVGLNFSTAVGYWNNISVDDPTQMQHIVKNSAIRAKTGIRLVTLWTSAATDTHTGPRRNLIDNVQFTPLPSQSMTTIDMNYVTDRNMVQKDELTVRNYNQVPGQDFRVYYKEQDANFPVPSSVLNVFQTNAACKAVPPPPPDQWMKLDCDQRPVGCPTAQSLTNAACFAQYGLAIAGSVTPCTDAASHPEIGGFTCPIGHSAPPSADQTAPVISAVASSNITATTARITWTTNETSDTQVNYGLTTAYGSASPLNGTPVINHVVNLSGLSPSTLYHYLVKSRDTAGNVTLSTDFTFTTTAASSSSSSSSSSAVSSGQSSSTLSSSQSSPQSSSASSAPPVSSVPSSSVPPSPGTTTPYHNIPDFCASPTITSVTNGPWSGVTTWSPQRVPNASDTVRISAGTTVTVDTTMARADCVGIATTGTLRFSTSASTSLTAGNVLVYRGGILNIGTQSAPIPAGFTAELIIANRVLDLTNDPDQYGTGLIGLGNVTMHGAVKTDTFVRFASEPQAGQSTITLAQIPYGWLVGDRVVIPDTRALKWIEARTYVPQWEERTITGISGTSITLSTPLQFSHPGARNADGVLEFLGHVGNLSRNVVVRSENPAGTRGHVFLTERANVDIRYALFRDLGRTTMTPFDPVLNHEGRYPLNVRDLFGPTATQANGYQFTLLGNAIDQGSANHTFKFGLAVEDSHYGLIQENVVYNTGGAAFIAFAGNETNDRFEKNFAVRVVGSNHKILTDLINGELGSQGSCFYTLSTYSTFNVNVCADAPVHALDPLDAQAGFTISPSGAKTSKKLPAFQGADPAVNGNGQNTLKHPISQFTNNEVYHTGVGLHTYVLGSQAQATDPPSTIDDFTAWHVFKSGVRPSQSKNIRFGNLTVIGSPTVWGTWSVPLNWEGMGISGESIDMIFQNLRVENMKNGAEPPKVTGNLNTLTPGVFQIIGGSLRNILCNILVTTPSSLKQPEKIPPRDSFFTGIHFGTVAGSTTPPKNICMRQTPTQPDSNLVLSDRVCLQDENGIAGNTHQVFYKEQAPSAPIAVSTFTTNTPPEPLIIGCPVAGLTAGECFNQYQVAPAGQLLPVGATTRSDIDGFVLNGCSGMSSPPPPPSSSSSAAVSSSQSSSALSSLSSAPSSVPPSSSSASSTPASSASSSLPPASSSSSACTAGTTHSDPFTSAAGWTTIIGTANSWGIINGQDLGFNNPTSTETKNLLLGQHTYGHDQSNEAEIGPDIDVLHVQVSVLGEAGGTPTQPYIERYGFAYDGVWQLVFRGSPGTNRGLLSQAGPAPAPGDRLRIEVRYAGSIPTITGLHLSPTGTVLRTLSYTDTHLNRIQGRGGKPAIGFLFRNGTIARIPAAAYSRQGAGDLPCLGSSSSVSSVPSSAQSSSTPSSVASSSALSSAPSSAPPSSSSVPSSLSSSSAGDATPPSVAITAPLGSATVNGTVSVTASASDNVGVTQVQFKRNGTNLGAADTTSPYSVSWNTANVSDGTHTLTAVARDAAGNITTSAAVTVTVSNAASSSATSSTPIVSSSSVPPSSSSSLSSSASSASSQSSLSSQSSSSPDITPPVITNMAITNITANSATVTWGTDEPSDTQVEYGKTKAYANATPLDPALLTTHTAVIAGLKADTLFHVRSHSRDQAGNLTLSTDFTFKTDLLSLPQLLLCGFTFDGMKHDNFSAVTLSLKDEGTAAILLQTTVATSIKGDIALNNAELSQITPTHTYALSIDAPGYFRQTLTGLDLASLITQGTCLQIPQQLAFGDLDDDGKGGLPEIVRILSWRHGTPDPLLEEIASGSGGNKRKSSNKLLLLAIKAWLTGQTDDPAL